MIVSQQKYIHKIIKMRALLKKVATRQASFIPHDLGDGTV